MGTKTNQIRKLLVKTSS